MKDETAAKKSIDAQTKRRRGRPRAPRTMAEAISVALLAASKASATNGGQ